jgi:histidine triad (HIT) family protein
MPRPAASGRGAELQDVFDFAILLNMKNDCLFCAIAAGEIPSFKIFEDDVALAFLDINPFAPGHVLVVPKAHATGLLDAPDERLAQLVVRVRRIAEHVKNTLGAEGFNILQNNGAAAGQTIGHLHFHIVPRTARQEGDAALSFSGTKGDMQALAALAAKLKMEA